MKLSPFSIILVFVALMIAGGALISRLSVNLYPSETLPSFRISFLWPEIPPLIIEKKVSSKLEAGLGMLSGIQELSSVSRHGRGEIYIAFNKTADPEMARFEIASKIRQLYPALPAGVSYPEIIPRQVSGSTKNLLVYSLTVPESDHSVYDYLEKQILPTLANIDGIGNVSFFGADKEELNIVYDTRKLSMIDVSPENLASAITASCQLVNAGLIYNNSAAVSVEGKIPLVLHQGGPCSKETLKSVPIKKIAGRIIYLGDVAEISLQIKKPAAFYRINGQSTVLISVDAVRVENRIRLAARVESTMMEIQQNMPESWVLQLAYDDTEHIKKDLMRVVLRMLFSLSVLLILILLITRNYHYFLLIMLTIMANVFIAAGFYYFLNIEIHLYSLAGITVSFGMIIDNSIVMIEHLRRHNNKTVFMALFAATLTTAGSLMLVFLLHPSLKAVLKDFAAVLLVNLLVSILIAWFFIPSVYQYSKTLNKAYASPKTSMTSLKRLYMRWLYCTQRYRYFFVFLIIMSFGMPLQYLPVSLPGDGALARIYNFTIGSNIYQKGIKTIVEKSFGGTLRLFANNVFVRSYYVDPERTTLLIHARMPEGSNVHQMNEAAILMENQLLMYQEIEQFQTRILSHDNSLISVMFKPKYDNEVFPVYLKGRLAEKALKIGSAEWQITGVGQGFSNTVDGYASSVSIILEGYNYEMLYRIAEKLQMLSERNPRITNQKISGSVSSQGARDRQEILALFNIEQLALMGLNANEIFRLLPGRDEQRVMRPPGANGQLLSIRLLPDEEVRNNAWYVNNKMIRINELAVLPKSIMSFDKRTSGADIYKYNQQYRLYFHFDFNGPYRMMEHVSDRLVEEIKKGLAVGYDARKVQWGWVDEQSMDYRMIILLVAMIFFMCAILFESLRQPLAVICIIPVSFIGLFLTFYLFRLNFDQGGFAAFVLLSGLTVNAVLYLLNDYNLFQKKFPGKSRSENYLEALNCKLIPIGITVISTVVGLLPFLVGPKEAFWFAFAAGTIGGLLFSFFAVLFVLPVFLKLK